MRKTLVVWAVMAAVVPFTPIAAQSPNSLFRVVLLGTGTPMPSPERLGPGTLVEAGVEKLIVDVGRGVVVRLEQRRIPYAAITGILLTHLHSDHVSGLPDLWLTGRFGAGRRPRETAVEVWGPPGTDSMVTHLTKAFEFDLGIRKALKPSQGLLTSHEIREGRVFARNGVTVSAFLVNHGNVAPALGYRIEFGGRSVVLSGDTKYSEQLIEKSAKADLLIYEVFAAAASAMNPDVTRALGLHISPEEAGTVFTKARPKLAVYSHIVAIGVSDDELVARTRKTYAGPLVVGTDLMSFDVADTVTVTPMAKE